MLPGRTDYRVYVGSSGDVTYNFPTVAKSTCQVKVKYFPFDIQECRLQFGSWSHHGLELDIVNRNPKGKPTTDQRNEKYCSLHSEKNSYI